MVAERYRRRHGRAPTFWLDKVCIAQDNIRDGQLGRRPPLLIYGPSLTLSTVHQG